MSDQQDIPQDEALAAEYVLRLLDADAEQAFEQRLSNEPALRELVAYWEAELATLAEELPEEAPSRSVRTSLMREIEGPSRQRGGLWSWLAFPALMAAAVAAFFVIAPLSRGPAFESTLHATLVSADGALHIEAGYAPDGNLFKVIPEAGRPAPGRDFELWVIAEGADAPVSLGVISTEAENLFEITPEVAALIDGGILAVSDEPEGGSPTGAPTGAVLATGEFFDADLFRNG